jgi:hypothetical protein
VPVGGFDAVGEHRGRWIRGGDDDSHAFRPEQPG